MSIIKTKKTENYCIIPNAVLEHKELSFKAKGLLCYLLSKPSDWQIQVKQLSSLSKNDGRDAIYSALKELFEAGYIEKIAVQGQEGKFICYDYIVYDVPLTEKADAVLPLTDFPPLTNNGDLLSKEENNIPKKPKAEIIREKRIKFCHILIEWVREHPNKYPKQLYFNFAKYWLEISKNGRSIRYDGQQYFDFGGRIGTFFKKASDKEITEMWEQESKTETLNKQLLKLF